MKKRKGFALAMVLLIMVFIIGISAVIMDMTTNYVSSSQATIDHQKLYNAAQSGIEWGKIRLYENRADLYVNLQTYNGNLDGIRAKIQPDLVASNIDTTPSTSIYDFQYLDLTVDILDCNYQMGVGQTYNDDLPIIRLPYDSSEGGGGTIDVPRGYSMIIDPNRVMTFSGSVGLKYHPFVIRATASTKDGSKSFGLESMVVMVHE